MDLSYNEVLSNPEKIIPQLSEKQIKTILIEIILAYIEKKIDLKNTVRAANLIKKYGSESLSTNMKNVLNEIKSMYVIDDVLIDILDELNEK